MTRSLEQRTLARVSWRLLPLAVAIYFIAYIDRTNIGFAALTMNRDLGLDSKAFAWGAGIFFLGYFIFEIPSNLILERMGARVWIARIMVTWGLASCAMAFVSGSASLLFFRFLLGVAEAGLFPGMILYFTYWFPKAYRARALAGLCVAMPASNVLASAVSGWILGMDGFLGLAGWKWIFILEAIPAFILAVVVLRYLTDRPAVAAWLKPDERAWLESTLEEERRVLERSGRPGAWSALTDWRVIVLSTIYFANTMVSYSISFYLPQIVKGMGFTNLTTGFVTAVPFAASVVAMVLWGLSSDRRQERRWHFAIASVVSGVGLIGLGLAPAFGWSLFWMSVAAMGLYATKPAFWPLPSQFLTGSGAAAGIALVNSLGNLGGFAGPYVVGWCKDFSGTYTTGLYFLAGCSFVSGIWAFVFLRRGVPAPPASAAAPVAVSRP